MGARNSLFGLVPLDPMPAYLTPLISRGSAIIDKCSAVVYVGIGRPKKADGLQEVHRMKKYFPAGADGTVWIVTISLMALLLLLLVLAGGITSMPAAAAITLYAVAGAIGLILLIGWLAKPIQYEIRDDSLSIVRSFPFSKITIGRSEIKDVRHVRLKSITPASVAVAWVFGYAGRFSSKELGAFSLFATSPRDAVLISAKQNYVISPANPKRFIQDLSGKK